MPGCGRGPGAPHGDNADVPVEVMFRDGDGPGIPYERTGFIIDPADPPFDVLRIRGVDTEAPVIITVTR